MAKVVRETERYKWVTLNETKEFLISLVIDKKDHDYDRIRFLKVGRKYREPEAIVVFRYEDEQLVESMIKTYGYKG